MVSGSMGFGIPIDAYSPQRADGGSLSAMFDIDEVRPFCEGLDQNLFFDSYEESVLDGTGLAGMVDKTYCFPCPLLQKCLESGIKSKSSGVWGGVYLDEGKVSKKYNAHKSAADWQAVAERID